MEAPSRREGARRDGGLEMSARAALRKQVAAAISACLEKKAGDVTVLQMDSRAAAFTDYFVICSGSNPRQIQAICDEVELRLAKAGLKATHIEGYNQAEWVLLDYVDFVVHVFSEKARQYYDLERLWRSAKRLTPADLHAITPKPGVLGTPAELRQREARPAARSGAPASESRRRAKPRSRSEASRKKA